MNKNQIPLLVVVSCGDYSLWYTQRRDSLDKGILDEVENSASTAGEITWNHEGTETLVIDPLIQQGG